MPSYRVTKQHFDGAALRKPGEIIEHVGPGNPDLVEPIDGAPMAPRRHDLPGAGNLDLQKRAELETTRTSLLNPK